ncbi:MAG: NUDIX domain-containing protein [Anaerolineales bacterium]|nr:NUDIX domain-containing protein [Anaerolineales bacterium]
MKADYVHVMTIDGEEIDGDSKTVDLPFNHVSARAIVVRRGDGCILGTLHRPNGKYALPGGALEDGESTLQAVQRELEEENFILMNPDWDAGISVDYYDGYKELSVWHIVLVDNAEIGYSEENIESKWISQDEGLWYPSMQEKIIMTLNRYFPELARVSVSVS